jgi:serine/threonine protein phosphatase 1
LCLCGKKFIKKNIELPSCLCAFVEKLCIMNNRTLIIGDIHGGLLGLKDLLSKANLTNDDSLIFLGDYVDGWSDVANLISYLIELENSHQCTFIKGNHDAWCEAFLFNKDINPFWVNNGGQSTMDSYQNIDDETKQIHLEFFQRLKLYHLDDDNNLFIHAGFTSMHGIEKETYHSNYYWDRTLWEMASSIDPTLSKDSVFYPYRLKHYKEIFMGHTPTINYDIEYPINKANVWNIDTGAGFKGRLSALDLVTKEVFQSEFLWKLYPNERGRN